MLRMLLAGVTSSLLVAYLSGNPVDGIILTRLKALGVLFQESGSKRRKGTQLIVSDQEPQVKPHREEYQHVHNPTAAGKAARR